MFRSVGPVEPVSVTTVRAVSFPERSFTHRSHSKNQPMETFWFCCSQPVRDVVIDL